MNLHRLEQYMTTNKQKSFDYDFLQDAQHYEIWEEIEIGREYIAQQKFEVTTEDVAAYNLALSVDDLSGPTPAAVGRETHDSPHPLFLVQIAFYCIEKGPGNWIRTPGARNPGQKIELFQPFQIGEIITVKETAWDKWIRRDKHYLQYKLDYYNQEDVLKATWWVTLIVPPTREALMNFIEEKLEVKR